MLFKTRIRLYGEVHEIVHKSGELLPAAFDVIEKAAGGVRRLRDVGARELVADMELGYELRVEVISSRKLPERKH